MDDKRWWDIISVGCPHNVHPREWQETLYAVLLTLDPDDIVRFDAWWFDRYCEIYREDINRAARLINGDFIDKYHHYFRDWLIGMGKVVYESALRSPDTLASVVDPTRYYDTHCANRIRDAWAERTGRTSEEYQERYNAIGGNYGPTLVPADWPDTDEELQQRFPRLYAMSLTWPEPE